MELIKLLPDYYGRNETMLLLQGILSGETGKLETGLGRAIEECFASTAETLLPRHERIYGIDVDVSQPDEYRRERIKAKLTGAGTTTREMIKLVASSFSNGEVEVIEDNGNGRFVIRFVGTVGIPGNMGGLTLAIEEIKPAHLAFTYEYTYNTHSDLGGHMHGQLNAYTHYQLRNEVLKNGNRNNKL